MSRFRIERHASLVHLVLSGERGNALDLELLGQIESAFDDLKVDGCPAVVLRADGRSFCTGLDLQAAFGLDRSAMRRLMEGFHRALLACFSYPAPVIAALSGHTLAGGALLAFCADERWMAHGSGRFGVHGTHLGVSYPQVAVEILRHQFGRSSCEALFYEGALRTDAGALEARWVDGLCEPEVLVTRAEERSLGLDSLAFSGESGLKQMLRAPSLARLATIEPGEMEAWLDQWFAPATREAVAEAVEALTRRTRPRPGEAPEHHA